jgi:hypothetical protein
MYVASMSLPKSAGHAFYRKLNRLLARADFDRIVEKLCEPHYHNQLGRSSIPRGVYFQLVLRNKASIGKDRIRARARTDSATAMRGF